jgi:hypothetical protein
MANGTAEGERPQRGSQPFRLKIEEVLLRARIVLGINTPVDDDAILIKVNEFCAMLDADMPYDRLEEVYVRAIQSKTNSFDLSVVDMNNAWRAIRAEEFKPHIFQCPGCEMVRNKERDECPFHKTKDSGGKQ